MFEQLRRARVGEVGEVGEKNMLALEAGLRALRSAEAFGLDAAGWFGA